MRIRDSLLLVGVAVIWGMNFVVIRWGLNSFPPLLFSGLRFTLCAVPILFGVRRPEIGWRPLLTLGVTLGLLVFSLLYLGIHFGLNAGLASVIMQAQVFFTIILSQLAGRERPAARTRMAMIVGFCGLALIALPYGHHAAILGLCLTLAGAASWGVSNVLISRLPPVRMFNLMVWISIVPPLPLFLLSFIFEGHHEIAAALSGMSLQGAGSVFYTALLSTLFAYGVWGAQIRRYSNLAVAPYALLVPVVGMASAAAFLDRNMTAVDLVGAVLTVAALAINAGGHYRQTWLARGRRLLRLPVTMPRNTNSL